jgi:hypothetical protein
VCGNQIKEGSLARSVLNIPTSTAHRRYQAY